MIKSCLIKKRELSGATEKKNAQKLTEANRRESKEREREEKLQKNSKKILCLKEIQKVNWRLSKGGRSDNFWRSDYLRKIKGKA